MFPSSPNQPQHMIHHNNSNPRKHYMGASVEVVAVLLGVALLGVAHPTRQQPALLRHPHNLYPPTYQQPPLPLSPFVNPSLYVVQQQFLGLQAHTPPWGEGGLPRQYYHGWPDVVGFSPAYQGVAWQYQHQCQPPRPGPSRNRHTRGHQKTEARTHTITYMYHLERSQEIIPPVSIQ